MYLFDWLDNPEKSIEVLLYSQGVVVLVSLFIAVQAVGMAIGWRWMLPSFAKMKASAVDRHEKTLVAVETW